jgi:H+/Cl- antiporter ClcA
MCKIMLAVMHWKSKFTSGFQTVLFLSAGALVMAALAVFVNEGIFGSGKELMTHVLFTNDKYTRWYMPLLRMIGPVCSFTSGAAGGVFAPALSAGASIGSLFSGWLELSPANTNLLILSGMVAFLTGVTRTPFTSAILVLEMTDRHNVIFQLMLAGMVSSVASLIIDRHSFYHHLKEKYIKELTTGI